MSEETNLQDCGPFRRHAIDAYCKLWSTPNPKGIFDSNVARVLQAQGLEWEEAPRSIYDPSQLYTALERYATDWSEFEKVDAPLEYGFRKAYKIFAKPKDSTPLTVSYDVSDLIDGLKMSKSSGLPMMTTKQLSFTYSLDRAGQILRGEKAPNPCVAYARTGLDNRTRLVWGYPLEMTIIESPFARPLIDVFKTKETPMAFGMAKAELGAKIHAYIVNDPGTIVALDYSKFDQTISATAIKMAFRILATWFTEEDRDRFGWKTIIKYFIHTPIVMPNGRLYKVKHHGVPSGSYFTQIIDSIVNVMYMYALKYACGVKFPDHGLFVLGDDVIASVRSKIELGKWAQYLGKHGLILHDDDKTKVGVPHFLGAVWIKGKPYGDLQEMINKACFPEKFRDYEGNPHTGAINVLRSYASSYLNGYRLLPRSARMDVFNYPLSTPDEEDKHLTGSEMFVRRYGMKAFHKNGPAPLLSTRLLT